jgi:hypothetical protein
MGHAPRLLQSACVGDVRAARRAGHSSTAAAIRIAAPMPPPQATVGMTTSSCVVEA